MTEHPNPWSIEMRMMIDAERIEGEGWWVEEMTPG
jgi:hypothetical protein